MPTIICHHCQSEITYESDGHAEIRKCANCDMTLDPKPEPADPAVVAPPRPPATDTGKTPLPPVAPPIASAEQADSRPEESSSAVADAEKNRQRVQRLLPPKFAAKDPSRISVARSQGGEVLVPDGAGGVEAVDASWVQITHRGETYRLRRSPRYGFYLGLIVNTLLVLIAIVMLLAILKVATG